ncbi:bifunctional UDP-N-acetylglucosamine pyrophosphorylase / Glucosamine-1-phosphate N-acetyltransferase [Propionibacterium cyclohexanicum]|uniref:Bifunctional protein GlmU n=1 Tax=Propionibacterium cyclohexanicum TaxID=64702 RepID=A0A1H9RJE6_9ACTN|nr:bifunctional UDP-N-acetylglucosamine diphosphorylase/glucosamine-1-phosphate N-acetyltransferase GlmU [Propionibacterium cyclohexanicum]SER72153.1 bifunctional UDP-N-acetylglucosamine pyrophosphorylase / Glucosamine-1-phosphate N-acetyltransferase [Propionibacterium cyclohexanicum]
MSTSTEDLDPGAADVSAVIVLAAGHGTRMKSTTSKLLHKVAGKSMLSYAVQAAKALSPQHLVVVVGHGREQVQAHLGEIAPEATIAVQEEQLGTGHAVRCGLGALPPQVRGTVVVTYADVPLLSGETLGELVRTHARQANAVTVLTAELDDPTGYGRIVRDHGRVLRIVEHKDATPAEREIGEVNSGIYVFDSELLREGLAQIGRDNSQRELYLTDVVEYANRIGRGVGAFQTTDAWQTMGVNDRLQLSRMNAEVNRRICEKWMLEGVTIADPASTWIEDDVTLQPDVTLLPCTQLLGATSVAAGAVIGPDTTLKDVEVGAGARVLRTHGELSVIGPNTDVGPWARLRPGTELGEHGKIGTFVETKNAKIGARSKVPHLSYCGDAILGEAVNIGAGTIFANYDGKHKSTSHLGDDVFIGSNSVLVAPVDIASGAFVAAGSTVTEDIPAGALAVARGRLHISEGWVHRRRPGTGADVAALHDKGAIHPAVQASREILDAERGPGHH